MDYRKEIGKMLSLIERMEGDMTPWQAMLNEEKKINESTKINEARWEQSGFVSRDGNSMVGGKYASTKTEKTINILDEFLQDFAEEEGIEDEYEDQLADFSDYCREHEDDFTITVSFSVSYDESTGYGSESSPIWEIEDYVGDENACKVIDDCEIIDDETKEAAKSVLYNIIDKLDDKDDNDFDEDDDEYEFEYDDDEY